MPARRQSNAVLHGADADEVMMSKPKRLLLPVVLEGPHEAAPLFQEDWTIVPGSKRDLKKLEQEHRRRDLRNKLMREHLTEGRCVRYQSSGSSMYPLVHANDACTFLPIQAITEKDGLHAIQKEASKIDVGDIVFCEVQSSHQYLAHIVLDVGHCDDNIMAPKYWIGNIQGHYNGWCLRQHIFGILVDVQVLWDGQYHSRPLPKIVFAEVQRLVKEYRWSRAAAKLCEPRPRWQ